MWNVKYSTNEPIYETETDSHREQTCGCQGGRVGEREVWGVWDWWMQSTIYRMDN